MKIDDAEALLAAIPPHRGAWADLGAGGGTFAHALARRLQPGSRIYAVDRDARALASLRRLVVPEIEIIAVAGDFTGPLELPGTPRGELRGLLFANALHFVPDPRAALRGLLAWLRPGGLVVIVEYDGRRPSRWVPYPISIERLPDIMDGLGLAAPSITASRPSAYGGSLYVAVTQRHS